MRSVLLAALLLTTPALAQTHPTTVGHPFGLGLGKASATTSASSSTSSNPLTQIQTVTVQDLQNALADANAQTSLPPGITQPTAFDATVTGGDTRHGNCWAALIKFVNGIQANNILPNQAGLATLQQKIFDDQQLVGKPLLPDYVVINCALTFNDAQMNLLQVTNWLGLKALTLPKL